MSMKSTTAIDYEQCITYYRQGRNMRGAATIERYLSHHPEIAQCAARDAYYEQSLAHHYNPVLNEPIPPRLLPKHQPGAPVLKWLASAASLLAVVGLSATGGWWLHGLHYGSPAAPNSTFGQQVAQLATQQPTMNAAARSSQPSSHPDLSAAGFRFQHQKMVSAEGQAVMAYNYRSAAGKPITIYSRALRGARASRPTVVSRSGVSLARWQSDGYVYALVGDLPRARLAELAHIATGANSEPAQKPPSEYPEGSPDPGMEQKPPQEGMERPVDESTPEQQAASGL